MLEFDAELIRRFDVSGPRYTSYPTADRFVEAYDEAAYRTWAAKRNIGGIRRPLSIYVHIPFCDTVCFYCACNRIITRNRRHAEDYLAYLRRELDLQAALFAGDNEVRQLHFGGGTPTYLSDEQLWRLMADIRARFALAPQGEYSIEVDPRKVGPDTVRALAKMGFNRMSLGVQDLDPQVQRAVNRIQSEAQTAAVVEAARAHGFRSVGLDLIYGLPKQSAASFARTLERVIAVDPDRIALYNYAHLPQRFKPQRRIDAADLPGPEEKLKILKLAIDELTAAGYLYIGMDHFAKPDDELAIAQRQGRLHRNFQGYSTHAECDLVGLGVSAIGKIGPTYAQNHRSLREYYEALDHGRLPIMRGLELSADDLLRRAVIQALICHFELSFEPIESSYLIDFRRYFQRELEALKELERWGLVTLEDDWIGVTPRGRLLVRHVCMVFDKYLQSDLQRTRYSKVI
ncbi:oxygen-independent coproporphyrinogen III oxidase [Pelomicrobium methylotrophicum]|nr:oxygen-independent coproporphyrinogen III oxidase [Pelomicrobium methylotrophicum]